MSDNNWPEWSMHVLTEIKRLNGSHENLAEKLSENSKILAVNTSQLELHIEGVRLAREQNNLLKEEMLARLEPLEKRSANFDGAWKLVGMLAATIAFLASIVKIIDFFHIFWK